MGDERFHRLFSPLQIRDVEIPNRIAVTGLGWTWAGVGEQQTLPTATLAGFWGQRAAGGLGLIVSEPQSVHPTSTSTHRVIENGSDAVIEPYRLVTEAVHAHGTIIIGQLNHAGHLAGTAFHSLPLWAPSEVRAPMGVQFSAGGGVLPHVMTEAEIEELTEAFAAAARRDIAAGFDGVEINAAEGYLLAQFLSPLTNHRQDGYGGSAEARMRLLLEVVQAVRAEIGAGPLVGVRIGTDDPIEGEFGQAAMSAVASALAAGGGVDYLSTTPQHPPHMGYEPGAYSELAGAAREASGLPVLYLGWVDGPATGEGLLESGICDLVGMPRATLADPELPKKARAGAVETIRPCVACNQSCQTVGSVCVLNPMLGAAELGLANGRESAEPRRVLVIGGGPAGAEAACLLAAEGHAVTVWERESEVGGQLRVAAHAPQRARLGALADYYDGELGRCGVTVELGREATIDDVRSFGADVVVVATGAFGHRPVVPGVDLPHVTDVRSILRGFVEPGEHVVVVLGRSEHRYQGLSVAEFVAAQGKCVHLVTDAFFAGDLWDQQSRIDTMRRLTQAGVTFSTMSELVAIRENEVAIRNRYSFAESELTADTVVLAFGDDADSGLLAELEADGLEVVAVGDVVAPRDLQGAMRDATMLALSV